MPAEKEKLVKGPFVDGSAAIFKKNGLFIEKGLQLKDGTNVWFPDAQIGNFNDGIAWILKGEKITEQYSEINDEFYITEDIDSVVSSIVEGSVTINDIKVFSGYSGWSPLQLESEIQRKMWTIVDVYNLDYTLPNDQNLWKKIMQNLGGEFLLWANAPEDVSLN